MKCNHCGFESEQDFEYCMNCGAASNDNNTACVEAVSLNPAADVVMGALKDKLFLVLCILMTASCVLSLSASGMPLLNILTTIFLWLTYADAQKGFVNEKHLQFISGVVYANYIITNVAFIMITVCGILLSLVLGYATGEQELLDITAPMFDFAGQAFQKVMEYIADYAAYGIGLIFTGVGVIGIVINVLCMRKIHRFAKSVYTGIMYQNRNFESPRTVKNWFVFIAVCCTITTASMAMNDATVLLTNACTTATAIIVAILINKHFVKQNF